MWVLTVLLVLIIISLSVVIGFLIKALKIQLNKHAVYEQWILETQDLVEKTYQTMKDLDNQQWFEKDDDVGVVFKQMVELIRYLQRVVGK